MLKVWNENNNNNNKVISFCILEKWIDTSHVQQIKVPRLFYLINAMILIEHKTKI